MRWLSEPGRKPLSAAAAGGRARRLSLVSLRLSLVPCPAAACARAPRLSPAPGTTNGPLSQQEGLAGAVLAGGDAGSWVLSSRRRDEPPVSSPRKPLTPRQDGGGAFPSVPPAPRPGLLHHQNGCSRHRRAAAPKLERLDPRQRKGFVIVALAGGRQLQNDAG
jgi:hypothetical protein